MNRVMNPHAEFSPLDGITYEDRLPVSWEVSPSLPSQSEQYRIDSDNQELLEALLILDEPIQNAEDEQEGVGQDHLRQLDVKLNLLMSLVRELLMAAVTLPDERSMQLGVQGLCIYDAENEDVQVGHLLKIRLFLDPRFPRPLVLHGHVSVIHDAAITLTYCPLGVTVQDFLDRYIFRHHRRAIAMTRQQAALQPPQ